MVDRGLFWSVAMGHLLVMLSPVHLNIKSSCACLLQTQIRFNWGCSGSLLIFHTSFRTNSCASSLTNRHPNKLELAAPAPEHVANRLLSTCVASDLWRPVWMLKGITGSPSTVITSPLRCWQESLARFGHGFVSSSTSTSGWSALFITGTGKWHSIPR